jgi:hypothetical protein
MVNTHEQGVLTNFLRLDGLELILVQFSRILELWIINSELITNYQGLSIKSVINNFIKLFYNFISEIKFEFKLWYWIYNFIEFIWITTNF